MGLLLLLIIISLFIIFRPYINEWFGRFMARRAEDMVRRMAGMPSRKEEQRRRKQNEKENRRNQTAGNGGRRHRSYYQKEEDGIKSMKEYAEDVEYTEIKEYSESTILEQNETGQTHIYNESQVSDVEFIETKS